MADNTLNNAYWGSAVLDSRSDEYLIKREEWETIEKALEGGKIWNKAVLERYECESEGKFELRNKWAWDRISVVPPLNALQNMARGSADQAQIIGASDRISKICEEDFDNKGSNWYSWAVENSALNTPAYGKFWIFASSPANITPITLKEEKDFQPFAFGRTPLQVINAKPENGSTRENGQFSDVLFLTSEIVINNETMYNDSVPIAVRMTRDNVYIIAVDDCKAYNGTISEHGIHGIGEYSRGDLIRVVKNPIGIVPARLVDIGESVIRGIVNASAQSINVQSGMFLGVFDGNYNQKVSTGAGLNDDEQLDLGTNVVLNLPENAKFEIVDAPAGEVQVARDFFEDTQNGVDVILQNSFANLAKKGGQAPSGEALTQMNSDRTQSVKVIMDLTGDALEDTIAWMHLLAGEKVPEDLQVKMPTSYESTTQKDRMELALDAQEITVTTVEGLAIRERSKWQNLATASEIEAVVTAEVAEQSKRLEADNILMLASADNLPPEESGKAGDGKNQAGAEGDLDED